MKAKNVRLTRSFPYEYKASKQEWVRYYNTLHLMREMKKYTINKRLKSDYFDTVVLEFKRATQDFRRKSKLSDRGAVYTLTFNLGNETLRINGQLLKGVVESKRETIRLKRRELRAPRISNVERRAGQDCLEVPMIGGVHTSAGFYSGVLETRRAKRVFEPKRPMSDERHVGIELEFTAEATREALGVALYNAGLSDCVELKRDGSISVDTQGHTAHELAICAKETEYKSIVTKVTEVLGKVNAKVNRSTGMHVHVDVRSTSGRDRNKVFRNLVLAQGILYAMQPASRKENQYCRKTKETDLSAAAYINRARYQGINPEAVKKYSTVEIRIHAGTVSAIKIVNWIDLLIAVADCANLAAKRSPRSVAGFCKAFNIGKELQLYIESRINKFNANAEVESA